MIKILKTVILALFFAFLIKFASLWKMSFIIGLSVARFSLYSAVSPLPGAFIGGSGSFLVLLLSKWLLGWGPAGIFTGVPGFCASLYWASSHWAIRVLLPAVCMTLFWMNPIGYAAFPYALYWLIPIVLYFTRKNYIFLEAFGSTFIAHAVGSVIWLYTIPMTAEQWINIIPLVIVERVVFASGMVAMYYLLSFIFNVFSHKKCYNPAVCYPIMKIKSFISK